MNKDLEKRVTKNGATNCQSLTILGCEVVAGSKETMEESFLNKIGNLGDDDLALIEPLPMNLGQYSILEMDRLFLELAESAVLGKRNN